MQSILKFLAWKENWPTILIPLVLLLWAQFGAQNLGLITFNSLRYYNSPYTENSPHVGPLPAGKPGQAVSKRVILIVIDALRDDTSRKLPTINKLRNEGADRVSVVGQPSFSLPGWTVIGTGAWQEQSSFTTNFPKNHIQLDTIFLAAKRAGLKTALVGSSEWGQLYDVGVDLSDTPADPNIDAPDHYKNMDHILAYDTELEKRGLEALKSNPDFALLYTTGVDSAGHGYGGASPEYLHAAMNSDDYIAQVMAQVDLNTTTVIITSDHGQIDKNWDGGGGHGGWEPIVLRSPLVAVGMGIQPGQYSDAAQADIAPTIATLLGLAIPTHNQGNILLDMINTPDVVKAARAIDNADQIANRYQSMLQVIGSDAKVDRSSIEQAQAKLATDDGKGAIDLANQSISATRAQWDAARSARLANERFLRLLGALYLLVPVALYVWWWVKARWNWVAPVVCGVIYLILNPIAYLLVRGLTYSITMFNTELFIEPFLTARVIDAVLLLVVVMVILGIWRRAAGMGGLARDTANALFVIAAGVMIQILVFYVLWDVQYSWVLPDTALGFKYYVDVFQTTAFWPKPYLPLAAILPLLAMAAGWVSNKISRVISR